MKANFAKFPKPKGGNNKDNLMYTDTYRNMTVDRRDVKAALAASDNGRLWWVYNYLMAYPFRIEYSKNI